MSGTWWTTLVDVAQDNGYIALSAIAGGAANLSVEAGGPVGLLEAAVAERSTRRLLTTTQACLKYFSPADDGARPPRGTTRVHVVNAGAGRFADLPTCRPRRSGGGPAPGIRCGRS